MKTFAFISILAIILCPITLQAQVESPPSMALGLSGLTSSTGSIDTELLAEIISDKQKELKKEFLKRTVSQKFEKRSYVLWEFMYSSLDILLEGQSKNAIKQNVLEYATNLAVVYGITEFYLQTSNKLGNSDLDNLQIQFSTDKRYFAENRNQRTTSSVVLKDLRKKSISSGDSIEYYFNTLVLDIFYDILKDEKQFQDLGLFKSKFYLGDQFYNRTSQYKNLSDKNPLKSNVDALYKRIKGEISVFSKNYLLLKQISNSEMSLEQLMSKAINNISLLDTTYAGSSVRSITPSNTTNLEARLQPAFDALNRQAFDIYDDLDKMKATPNMSSQLAQNITDNLAAFERFSSGGVNGLEPYDLYFIHSSMKPLLVTLTTKYQLNTKYLKLANGYSVLITAALLNQFQEDISSRIQGLGQEKLSELSTAISIISNLDQLDQAKTYEYVFDLAKKSIEIIADPNESTYMSTVIDNLRKYMIVDEKNKRVDISVEDVISAIYTKYANRRKSPVDLYFSIGINQSISSEFSYNSLIVDQAGNPTDTTLQTLDNLAFASEKIGIKIKLLNWAYYRSHAIGESYKVWGKTVTQNKFRSETPIVSDLHLIVFGSGLLYKIAALSSAEEFADPLIGAGLGVSFFNSIDLNISHNWPLSSNNDLFNSYVDGQLWTVSFDIKISEYLTRLGEKRKENKQ